MTKNHILEVKEVNKANDLINSFEWRLERYSETRDCYILVRRLRVVRWV